MRNFADDRYGQHGYGLRGCGGTDHGEAGRRVILQTFTNPTSDLVQRMHRQWVQPNGGLGWEAREGLGRRFLKTSRLRKM